MTYDRLNLRLPVEMKAWLEARAQANHRTMNGELIALLEVSQRGRVDEKGTA